MKQAKFRQIESLLDDPAGKTNLDIGADNGVISYLLRRQGGEWHSADLDERAVDSIRQLVGRNVYRLEGARTPFPDQTFDQVVVVDYLEHPGRRHICPGAGEDREARRASHHQRAASQAWIAAQPPAARDRPYRRVARPPAVRL